MPSDLPPRTPSGITAPATGGTASGGAPGSEPTVGSAAAGSAGAGGTGTADVRRYSAQNRAGGPEKQAGISNSFALAMIVAFAVLAAVMIRQGPGLLPPPPRELPPVAGGAGASAVVTAPPVSANSPVVRAYGSGTVNQAARQAQRVGQAAGIAALCGLRSRAWVNDVREALGKQLAVEFPTFDPEVNAVIPMQQHIMANYQAGQETSQQALDERGRETMCADLPYSPDYRMAVRVGEQANIRSR